MIKNRYLSSGLLSFILLAIMYSFGTFGFLNLLGARSAVQVFLVGFMSYVLVTLEPRYKIQDLFPALAFFCSYAIGSLVHSNNITGLVEAVIMSFVIHVILSAPARQVLFLAKTFVLATSFLCILVSTAYIYYKIHPDKFIYANFDIYSSVVGQQQIFAHHFMDWISFTSGDGFVFQGEVSPRLKGYSNEPSSTVVHYLAPAVLAFLLGGRFIYLGVFILLVNFIFIASFTGQIIVSLSFVFFIALKFFRRYFKYAAFILIPLFVVFLLQSSLLSIMFDYVGGNAMHFLGFDLISRKLGDGSQGSLGVRQDGLIDNLAYVLSSPYGYSTEKLGAGAGLVFIVSSHTGWIGLVLFGLFLFRLFNELSKLALATDLSEVLYSVALSCSVLLITLFVSGYGWGRPPGVIILFLFFRMFELSNVNSKI